MIFFSILIVATVGLVFQNSNSGAATYTGPHGDYRYEDIRRPWLYSTTDVPQGYAQSAVFPYREHNDPFNSPEAYQPQGYSEDRLRTVSSYSLYPYGYRPDVPYNIYGVGNVRESVRNPAYTSERSYYGRGVTVKEYQYPRVYGSPTPYSTGS